MLTLLVALATVDDLPDPSGVHDWPSASVAWVVIVAVLVVPAITGYLNNRQIRELRQPVRETHHQVTVNKHASAERTIADRLDDLEVKADEFRTTILARLDVQDERARERDEALKQHTDEAAAEVGNLWAALRHLGGEKP